MTHAEREARAERHAGAKAEDSLGLAWAALEDAEEALALAVPTLAPEAGALIEAVARLHERLRRAA